MTRQATIRTVHDDAATVAAAVRPDNTPEVETRADGDTVATRIEREDTSGLSRTVDDYVVNLRVADRVVDAAQEHGHTTDTTTDT